MPKITCLKPLPNRRQSVSSLYQASESTPPGGNQTLDNIRRVTDARDSFLNYRYKDENGDMIMVGRNRPQTVEKMLLKNVSP